MKPVYLDEEPLTVAVLRCGGWGLHPRMYRSIILRLRTGRFRRVAAEAPSAVEFL